MKRWLLSLLIIGADQTLKYVAYRSGDYVVNKDWILGNLEMQPFELVLINLFFLVCVGLLYYISSRQKNFRKGSLEHYLFIILIASSFSNFFDRILYGGIIDLYRIPHVSVYNLADALITISVLSLIIVNAKKQFKTTKSRE